jgi:hypothetical protein
MPEFEERADQLTLAQIEETLADGHVFREARKKLLGRGAKLLVGPRGTGKTHVMRFTYSHAMNTASAPVALYANFSHYLNLEPLLKTSTDALQRFHSWVIAKLLISAFELLTEKNLSPSFLSEHSEYFDESKLRELVSLLERQSGDGQFQQFGRYLTIDHVKHAVILLCKIFERPRAILLLDDAALSLAEPFLIAFFEIFRLLKTDIISPKAAVYPGSTQYGPTFHASHEAEEIPLWLSIEDPNYSGIMGDIADRHVSELNRVNADVIELLKYVAFGIPRAYLRLLREFLERSETSIQQKLNIIIERQTILIGTEYESLGLKLTQFQSVIATGKRLFDKSVVDINDAQKLTPNEKNITLGIHRDQNRHPLAERMIRFLVEFGMLYPLSVVSHGPNRKYDRFIPHVAFLQQQGVFRSGRGSSPRDVKNYLERPASKHPLRRDLSTLLTPTELTGLKLDLPPCKSCGTMRMNDSQLFCHHCGKELIVASLFENCMNLPLEKVPGISVAMIARIHSDTQIRTVGHVYASQSPSADLQQANLVGPIRARQIISKVYITVNEFLS